MANRLKKMLTEEMVRLDPPLLSTPEEVIEYCGNILVENKKAKAGYVKEMIDSYQRFGPFPNIIYFVVVSASSPIGPLA